MQRRSEINKFRHTRECLSWRHACLRRANGKCELCGNGPKRNMALEVHHRVPYITHVELRAVVENGIVLCSACHCYVHSNAGKEARDEMETDFFSLWEKPDCTEPEDVDAQVGKDN